MPEDTLPNQGIESFPEEVREDVEGLIWLGHLETEIEYCQHTFVLRTLKADEELTASLLAKEYLETMGQAKAWAWANVSQAIVSVDGNADWCPPAGPSKKDYGRQKFNYCIQNWYWHIGDHLWQNYLMLVQRQLEAVDNLRNLSGRSLRPSTPFADSLTDQDDSESQPEILQHLEDDSTESSTS